MSLTKKQRIRLARAARRLAMECAAGTAPDLGIGWYEHDGEQNCAVALCNERVGQPLPTGMSWSTTLREIGGGPNCWTNPLVRAFDLVAEANDADETRHTQHARLVFPLLALADALDSGPVEDARSAK